MTDRPTNIAAQLRSIAQLQPDRPAVVCPVSRDPRGRVKYVHLTFKQLDESSDRIAHGLQRTGLRPGMRTVLMVPPSLEFFELTFALFKLGAIPILVDPGMGLTNLGKCLSDAGPQAFIGSPKAHLARLLLGWGKKTVVVRITTGTFAFLSGRTLRIVKARGRGRGPFPLAQIPPGEMSAILFTSGSTGPAKGVVYTHEFFNSQIEQIRQLYGIEPGEIDLPTFPLFALFGPALGMTSILPEMDPTQPAQVDAEKLVQAIEQFKITSLFGSPAVINRLGRFGASNPVKLPTLKRVISAGAPVSGKVIERLVPMLPAGAQVHTPYGATECLPVCSIGSDEILRETRQQTDQGKGVCVGVPVPGLAVKVIRISDEPIDAWEDSLELSGGEIGEICVKGTHVTREYYNQPQATALAKIKESRDGGFYHRMGDLGYRDQLGRIWFCGRKSQRVVTQRGTLYTIPCEAVFNTHPAVFRSALVGVRRGSDVQPVICIELEPDFPTSNQGQVEEELIVLGARYAHTRPIKTVLFHPGFPVDVRHNSKIYREQLAVWASRKML